MKIVKYIFISFIFCLLSLPAIYSQVYVNEIMASNNGVYADDDGDFSDWIELYNAGNETVDISGWFLSDDNSEPYKWRIGHYSIPAGSFLLIWASGKNRQLNGIYHTNFQIKSGSELIILSNSLGQIIDEKIAFSVPEGCSVGLKPDGCQSQSCLVQASPGDSNNESEVITRAPDVEFSTQGGCFKTEFTIALSCADAGATIIFTLDGSDPKLKNIDGVSYKYKNEYPIKPGDLPGDFMSDTLRTFVYSQPIRIYDRSNESDKLTHKSSTVTDPDYFPDNPVPKATVIRASVVKEGMLDSEIKSETYFIGSSNLSEFGLPVISISVDADKLFGYYDGIYTAGIDFDNWRNTNPQEEYLWPYQGNFKRRGNDNELIVNFQLFAPNESNCALNQNIGLKIFGSESRSFPMKSLSLCSKKAYGQDNINFKMFDYLDDTVFDQVILHNCGSDFPWTGWEPNYFDRTMLRDAYIHQLVKNNGFGIKEYNPAIVFINGEFWGIHTLREDFSKGYFNRHYNLTDIDLLTGNASVVAGSNYDYVNYLNNLRIKNPLSEDFITYVETEIDIKAYFDYVISEIFIHNTDWPYNNTKYWRYRTNEVPTDSLCFYDGRYRWLFYDADIAFGLYDLSYNKFDNDFEYYFGPLENICSDSTWENFPIRHLLISPELRDVFIERFEFHLLNTFNTDATLSELQKIYTKYKNVMPMHLNRWCSSFYSVSDWEESVNKLRVYAIQRPCEIREMLKEYFKIKNPIYAFGVCETDYFTSDNFCDNIFVYPCPATDIVTVRINQQRNYACKIDLCNSFGEVLMFNDYHVFDTELSFNISELPQAVYYIRIECGELYCVKKFVKI